MNITELLLEYFPPESLNRWIKLLQEDIDQDKLETKED